MIYCQIVNLIHLLYIFLNFIHPKIMPFFKVFYIDSALVFVCVYLQVHLRKLEYGEKVNLD